MIRTLQWTRISVVTCWLMAAMADMACAQAVYVRDYHWISGNATASLGSAVDDLGFLAANQTGVHYGFHTVKKTGPPPQQAHLRFRSLSLVSSATGNGYCKAESSTGGVDAVGSVGGGVEARCTFFNSGYGSFMSVFDFDDTTFDYELKCGIDTASIDDKTTLSVRFGVPYFKHGLKAVFDKFDAEWDLYGWFWTPTGYSWVKLPDTAATLDYSLTRFGGPIGWGQLAVAENMVNLGCTAINFGIVVDGDFRASVLAR